MTPSPLRLAMWSGPRNISTALLRSWGSRPDTVVCDEPLYAHYLLVRGDRRHPGFDEIVARHATDVAAIARWLTGPLPEGRSIFYQKHMAHHLLPDVEGAWIDELAHGLLIREPREMLASLAEFLPEPRLEDTGLPQQTALLGRIAERTGRAPPVIDAADVLRDPRGMLTQLCGALGVPFLEEMLQWEPGPRPTDGAWGPHWYDKVYRTTTFGPYVPREVALPPRLEPLLADCERLYERLHAYRLRSPADGGGPGRPC